MKSFEQIAVAPDALPLVGHAIPLLRDPLRFLVALPAHGDLVRIRLGAYQVVAVCDPDLLDQVMRDDRTFDKGGALYERAVELVGDGLVTCSHSRHRRQRRLTQPVFHSSRFPMYTRTMMSRITEMTDSWQPGQVLDVQAEIQPLIMKIALDTMFSDALTPPELDQAVRDISTFVDGMFWRTIIPPRIADSPLLRGRRYRQAHHRLRRTVDTVISNRRVESVDRGDLLSALFATREPGMAALADAEISDQAITFFVAGSETAAVALSWALYLLATHPEIEERLHREVTEVLAGATATYEHIPRLTVARRIVAETLRLYPPVWILTRTVTADTELGCFRIPAGTTVVCSPYLIHHRDDLFDSPERFDPDRWDNPDRPEHRRSSFLPFGAGPRVCIGNQFSQAEIVLALAEITAHWRLRPVSGRIRPKAVATLRPAGLRLRVMART